ncbi:MAG TPA: hypothetical protein VHO67_08440 [Polyangia bacterium]|nr:hypothetical protein [Polyangia bacterium]
MVLAWLMLWPLGWAGAEASRPSLRLGEDGGVIVLSAGGILAWNRGGEVQVMRDDGWEPLFRVRATGEGREAVKIIDAIGLSGRALLLAEYARHGDWSAPRAAVFELGSAANVRQLSRLPAAQIFVAMTRWKDRAWIQDVDGEIRELLSDGQLGQRISATSRAGTLDVGASRLLGGPADSPVFYVSPDRTKANDHPGYCYADGRSKWRLTDGCEVAPTVCGDHFITTGADRMTVVVRSVADARPLATWQTDREPLIVCDEDGGVLIGRQTVAKFSLPDLTRRWVFRLKSGRAEAIAGVQGRILIWTDGESIVWVPATVTGARPAR